MILGRIRTSLSGAVTGPSVSTTYWQDDGIAADMQLAIDHVRDAWAALTTGFSSALNWNVSGAVDLIDSVTGALTGSYGLVSRSGGATGAGLGVPLPTQCLIRLTTGTVVAGRRLKGHLFIPGCLGANAQPAGPSGVSFTQLNAFCTAMLAGTHPNLVVWSKTHGATGVVTGLTAATSWGVLRSRRD